MNTLLAVVATFPIGYIDFCKRMPSQCRSAQPVAVERTAVLDLVNRQVNNRIRPKADPDDRWQLDPREGDCEDYAVTKRQELHKAGVPWGAFKLGMTRVGGVLHVVLIVSTTGGDVVLDNLRPNVSPASDYQWVSIQFPDNPHAWRKQ